MDAMAQEAPPANSIFFTLPPELRNAVYEYVLPANKVILVHWDKPVATPPIAQTDRHIRHESLSAFYAQNEVYITALWRNDRLIHRLLLPAFVVPHIKLISIQEYPCEHDAYTFKICGGLGSSKFSSEYDDSLCRYVETCENRSNASQAFLRCLTRCRGPKSRLQILDLEILVAIIQTAESTPKETIQRVLSRHARDLKAGGNASSIGSGVALPISLSLPSMTELRPQLEQEENFDPLEYWNRIDDCTLDQRCIIPYINNVEEALETLPRDCTQPEYLLQEYPWYLYGESVAEPERYERRYRALWNT
jgi:hypothetical protein